MRVNNTAGERTAYSIKRLIAESTIKPGNPMYSDGTTI